MPSHVLLLNWNSADDTIECLSNLIACNVSAKFIVADNASADGSAVTIAEWAIAQKLRTLSVDEADIDSSKVKPSDYDLVIICNSANHGFAGGNNTSIRFASSRSDDGFIWLLNNDARVNAETFPKIIERFSKDDSIGFVGSAIRYYERPDTLQCFGGCIVHPIIGKRTLYGKGMNIGEIQSLSDSNIDYLMGASLAIRPKVIADIGLMEHAYFMYAEEMDWQLRGKNAGWTIAVAPESHIFHKGAASTSGRSHMYHYYINRASVMFSKRFFGRKSLLTVLPSLFAIILLQNFRSPLNVIYGWKGVAEGARFKWTESHPFPRRKNG